jgi:hypothetical protein
MSQSLINMAKTPEQLKEESEPFKHEPDKYPWGLELHLGKDELEKLGITDLPPVGTEFSVVAASVVERVSASSTGEGEHKSMTLQITELALDGSPAKQSAEEQAASLFPSKD